MRRYPRTLAATLAVICLSATLVAGCGDDHPPVPESITTYATLERFRSDGRASLLLRPTADELRGLVIYHHGAGEDEDSVYADVKADVVARILEDDWAIASVDAGDTWGSADGLAAYRALWREVRPRVEPDRVVHLSHSMGGLTGLNCIAVGCDLPAHGWIGIYPVTDQRTVVDSGDAATFLGDIQEAFDGEPVPDRLIPVENPGAFVAVPMLVWASPDDITVPMATNAAALAERVEAAGGQVDLRVASGGHGDPSHFDPDAVAWFLGSLP